MRARSCARVCVCGHSRKCERSRHRPIYNNNLHLLQRSLYNIITTSVAAVRAPFNCTLYVYMYVIYTPIFDGGAAATHVFDHTQGATNPIMDVQRWHP